MCIYIHVSVHVFCICDIGTHFMYAEFILLFYLWLLGQRRPTKEVQTNISLNTIQWQVYILSYRYEIFILVLLRRLYLMVFQINRYKNG